MHTFIMLLAILILGEFFAFLIYQWLARKDFPRHGIKAVQYLMSKDFNFFPGEYAPRPYSLYWNKPNHMYLNSRQTDKYGYRWHGSEIEFKKDLNEYRIFCLGGSTTFSNHVSRNVNDSWCYKLEFALNQIRSKKFRVINAGLNYAMTPELVTNFLFIGSKFEPDLVIMHGPGNDTLPLSIGDFSPDYHNTRSSLYFQKRKLEGNFLRASKMLRLLYILWLDKSSIISLEPSFFPEVKIQSDFIAKSDYAVFESNLKSLTALVKASNSKLVLASFLQASEQKLETFHPGLGRALIIANSKMSEIMHRLSNTNEGVYYLDFSQYDFDDDFFVDGCHLKSEGEALKSKIILQFLQNNKLI